VIDSLTRGFQRILKDFSSGRNIESYVVSAVGVALVILDLIGDVSDDIKLTVMIAALVILVFRGTKPENKVPDLDQVLLDRQNYGPFREFIANSKELWIYGPSAANALREAAYIESEILEKGGKVRMLIQNPTVESSMNQLKQQLDRVFDLEHDIDGSLRVLRRMKRQYPQKLEFKLLSYNPGFSLTVVNPDNKNGHLVVEFIGYRNDRISNRMHINIARTQSAHWFEFWEKQFRIMWDDGKTDEEVFGVSDSPPDDRV